jgi:hypothetical protein
MLRFNVPLWKMCAGYFFFSSTLTDYLVVSFFFCVEAVTTYLGILCYGVTVWGELLCQCAPLLVTARCRAFEP